MKTYAETIAKLAKSLADDYRGGGNEHLHAPDPIISWLYGKDEETVSIALKQAFTREIQK